MKKSNNPFRYLNRSAQRAALFIAAASLAACATPERTLPEPLFGSNLAEASRSGEYESAIRRSQRAAAQEPSATGGLVTDAGSVVAQPSAAPKLADSKPTTQYYQTPPLPPLGRTESNTRQPGPGIGSSLAGEVADINVNFEQIPLTQLINTVFGNILKRTVSIDPAVAQKRDMVSLRTAKPQSPSEVFNLMRALLKSYGLAVSDIGGLIRVQADTQASGYSPEIRRGRALPDVPPSLRPVFYLAELDVGSVLTSTATLRSMFPGGKLTFTEDGLRNALLIGGSAEDVAAALEALNVLEQPLLRGRSSARIAPAHWNADELARKLVEVLQVQGYSISIGASASPIILVPVAPLNSIIVFSTSPQVMNHVLRWARDLDQPSSARSTSGYFTYPVRNTDASEMAKTLQEILGGSPPGPAAAGAPPVASSFRSRVVVNRASNTLIIQGGATEYQQIYSLLQELDRPAKSALVTVTIAEVSLNSKEQLGFEWMLSEFIRGGSRVNVSTLGQFATGSIGGLSATFSSTAGGDPRAILNMLASDNKVRILSNPSVVTRNGETATIQVGQEVPVITSQQSSPIASGGLFGGTTSTTLQTVQYRTAGVVLKVKPVIHAGGRIDLDVSQEVSSSQDTKSGVTSTPTFSTRKLDTKMTVVDGQTLLLGGLMSEQTSFTDTGVPRLKDIPIAGALFKSTIDSTNRTELVMLITSYVMNDDFETQAVTQAFREQFRWSASNDPRADGKPKELKLPARPVVDGGLGSAGAAPQPSSSPAYVVPEASRDVAGQQQPNNRLPATSGDGFPQRRESAEPQGASSAPKAPASSGARTPVPNPNQPQKPLINPQNTPQIPQNKPPGVPTDAKELTDEALKKEILDAIRK
jgi:general secretion pathway protein D